MSPRAAAWLTLSLLLVAAPAATAGATIVINNVDPPGEGFNDPTPVEPAPRNPGATLGEQRMIAFRFAADLWGALLHSDVEIVVQAAFRGLPCSAGSAVLASTGTARILANFDGAPFAGTWYQPSLANKLAGRDLTPGPPDPGLLQPPFNDDMFLLLNVAIDEDPTCLAGAGWYYGLDNKAGSRVDLLSVLMHEMAHGLGFANFVNEADGSSPGGLPDAYSRRTLDTALGRHWHEMTPAERAASAVSPGRVVWDGPHVGAQAPHELGPRPVLRIVEPESAAGLYEVTTATFGPAPTSDATALELLAADDGAGTTADACEPLVGSYAGTIVLVRRGSCAFTTKVAHAQAAGAAGVVVVNNEPLGLPPMTGQDASILIPSVGLSQADGAALAAELPGVTGMFAVDRDSLAGTDAEGQVRLYANTASGSAISHWDLSVAPSLLMEPVFHPDLRSARTVDLTSRALADLGWDECPDSDFAPVVAIGDCDPGVPNRVMNDGCTVNDVLAGCDSGGSFDRQCLNDALGVLAGDGAIDPGERQAIRECAFPKGRPDKPPRGQGRPTAARGRG